MIFGLRGVKPCRIENSHLVAMYNRLNPFGLEIIGVSLDNNKNKWIQAIKDDGLVWQQVSHLKFWKDPIAKLYNITAIPASFILNEKGIIIDKNIRGINLEKRISALLNVECAIC